MTYSNHYQSPYLARRSKHPPRLIEVLTVSTHSRSCGRSSPTPTGETGQSAAGCSDQDLDLVAGGLHRVQQFRNVLVAPRFEVEFHLGGVDRDVLGGAVVLDCVDVGPGGRQQVD